MLKAMEHPSSIQFLRNSLLGNLFISSGEPGPVLKIHCKGRTGPKNLVSLPLKSSVYSFHSHVVPRWHACVRSLRRLGPRKPLVLAASSGLSKERWTVVECLWTHFFKTSSHVHDLQVKMCFSLTGQVPRYARLLSLSNPQWCRG